MMRRRPGAGPTSSPKGRCGGGAVYGSPVPGPATTSSNSAVSRTVRVSACLLTRPSSIWPDIGPSVLRPRRGLSPTTPQHDDGIRIDPVPSPPEAAPISRAATAAADPPLDPPGDTAWFHGFRVGPDSAGSVAQ